MPGTILDAGSFLRDVVKIILIFESGKCSKLDPDQSKWRTRPAAIWWFVWNSSESNYLAVCPLCRQGPGALSEVTCPGWMLCSVPIPQSSSSNTPTSILEMTALLFNPGRAYDPFLAQVQNKIIIISISHTMVWFFLTALKLWCILDIIRKSIVRYKKLFKFFTLEIFTWIQIKYKDNESSSFLLYIHVEHLNLSVVCQNVKRWRRWLRMNIISAHDRNGWQVNHRCHLCIGHGQIPSL